MTNVVKNIKKAKRSNVRKIEEDADNEKSYMVKAKIGGVRIKFLIDSGTSYNVIENNSCEGCKLKKIRNYLHMGQRGRYQF